LSGISLLDRVVGLLGASLIPDSHINITMQCIYVLSFF